MHNIIETKDLKKTFPARGKGKEVEAVRGITFSVKEGEIFGLLGPNGAGKTTTMRMLSTLLLPTSGEIHIVGHELPKGQAEVRKAIGYVGQVGGMQREGSGRENLMLQARLYGMTGSQAKARVSELIELLGLGSYADRKTSTYSGGQKRIFDLAAGIVHRPRLLFLDEPSTGLDPQNRAHVWEQVRKLHIQGTTVFLTTHYLEEADALCKRVAIVDRGTIVALGEPEELKRKVAGDVLSLGFAETFMAEKAQGLIVEKQYVRDSSREKGLLHVYVEKGEEHLPAVMKTLHDEGISAQTIQLSRPTLDDVFLKLTGRTMRESEEA